MADSVGMSRRCQTLDLKPKKGVCAVASKTGTFYMARQMNRESPWDGVCFCEVGFCRQFGNDQSQGKGPPRFLCSVAWTEACRGCLLLGKATASFIFSLL